MNVYTSSTTHTHVVNYITEKMLLSLGNIIRGSGLSMERFANNLQSYEEGIRTWLRSGHLDKVILEIYDPATNALVRRWDFELFVGDDGDVGFWFDPDDIRYHLLKAGKVPSQCSYAIIVTTKPGRPEVPGWSRCDLRDTTHLRRFCLGTTVSASHTCARPSYWR
jgi:hypothetical protein